MKTCIVFNEVDPGYTAEHVHFQLTTVAEICGLAYIGRQVGSENTIEVNANCISNVSGLNFI